MDIRDVSIIHHIGIVLVLIWILSYYSCCNPVVYVLSIFYLYQVHDRYIARLRRKLQFEERKQANQKRVLADSETVRWLNHAVERVWPICMEQITSQKVLLPIVPWFLEKYKPWTAKKAVVQHMYLGRNPPTFTEMRVLRERSDDDDHLVMELGMNFLTADDMSAILAVKLRRRLGFGMWAKMHVTGMHIEGKVLVGVKFLREYPFLGRLRVCFVEPPYFQMTVKPMFSHGIDVTELPGIAGWLDKLLAVVFEQTLVEPNMLVVDMEKFASAPTENNWFSVNEKDAIAYAKVEVVEGAEMKPSDPNGLADPYVKGQLGPYRFRTKIQKKTLSPKWHEEFKIPICTWESPNVLVLEVCDKDHFRDDTLGECSVNITDLRGRPKEDMWLPLQNIKMGKLHLVVTVIDADVKEGEHIHDEKPLNSKASTTSAAGETAEVTSDSTVSPKKAQKMPDEFEPIDIEGQEKTGIWVHHPGSDVSRTWEPRKRKSRQSDIEIHREDNDSNGSSHSNGSGSNKNGNSSSDENEEGHRSKSFNTVRKGLRKIGLAIHKIHTKEDPSTTPVASPTPRANLRAVNTRGTNLKIITDDDMSGAVKGSKTDKEILSTGTSDAETPNKGNMKGAAKNFLKHSAHSLKHVLSRKGSNKNKDDSGSVTNEADYSRISDVVGAEPLSSSMPVNPTIGNNPTASHISIHDKETPNYTEQNVQVGAEPLSSSMAVNPSVGNGNIPTASHSSIHDKEPPNHTEQNVQVGGSDPATKFQEPPITKVPVQDVEQADMMSFSDVREGLDEKNSSNTVNDRNSVAAEKCSSNMGSDMHQNIAFSSTVTH